MKSRSRISIAQTQRLQLTLGLAASIRVLHSDAAGLSRYLEEQAAENPHLVLTPTVARDWLPRWTSALARQALPEPAEAAAPGASLIGQVFALIDSLRLSPRETAIAAALAEAMEPSGWLGLPLARIAERAGAPEPEVAAVLDLLQKAADPPGLFARNLADCLRLQAIDAGDLDAAMVAVLDRLDLVAVGDGARIAREAGLDPGEVRTRIDRLRGYDPKPGARFDPHAAPLREPDLLASKAESGWVVALNRSALPTLTLAEAAGQGRAGRGGAGQGRAGRAEARALIRMVEGRNATLLTVGQEILLRQVAALEAGPGALVPMTMAEVAEAVGMHVSTVSRVVAGTAVDTPRGTWWLRSLFTQSAQDGGPAAGALRDRLARLVAAEDRARPLSDADLAAALSDTGAPLARRTVAKYRALLGLPPAHRRKARHAPSRPRG
ncbi:MAG: RNA polymerase sigma-54 factor [Rhodobacterales bacterium 32-66-7]|nr:MAG: RNA polymerase sigma-54 factor [Rhodobacterales bacterium 32-66-7]